MLINPNPKVINTRGCGPLMKYWYRRGFWENIFMSLFGIFMGVIMIFVFYKNHKEFIRLRDEADDRKRIIQTQSMASLRSTNNYMNRNPMKSNERQYPYTNIRNSPVDDIGDGYISDDDNSIVFDEPRPMLGVNA